MAPGTSPFRVKGPVYQKMKEDTDRECGEGRLRERLGDPALRESFDQPFFASVWYDALPITPLAIAHARLVGVPMHTHCREKGRGVAGQDVPGIYRALLRLFSPVTLVGRLPRAATFYFDFGASDLEWLDERHARTTLSAVPASVAPVLAGVIEGFMAMALELTRAPDVHVRTLEVVYDGGVLFDVPTAAIRHECRWGRR